MRIDTATIRSPRTARFALAATGSVLTLVAGIACSGGEAEPEVDRPDRPGQSGTPIAFGDLEAVERPELASLLDEAGTEGTFVLHDVREASVVVVDAEQARERAVPASTFKLPNTLIALETGVVSDLDEVVSDGGEDELSLRESLPTPDVSLHQEVAERIGYDRMSTWVDRFDYGNRKVGEDGELDRFWVDGPLEITAVEQTTFLAALVRADLPVEVGHQEALREMLEIERGDDYALYGRTGLGAEADPVPGWWVGWVENGDDLHTFALRLDMDEDTDPELRESLGRDFLVELDVLPPSAAGA
ncbi:penicillin-binding transpeptidase domain-containing protein [Nocardiopsis listeri]|uniref:penicillin-binding transpeptidase domain-containing protein n=1 Tax=Nocardiopsis listeri TaxID=53440 RepID=UPI00082BCC6A|nr:penicillin-binding transpeptidase domain-containing protein [Nocardiopsis listeri]